jgi:hypothetical protein
MFGTGCGPAVRSERWETKLGGELVAFAPGIYSITGRVLILACAGILFEVVDLPDTAPVAGFGLRFSRLCGIRLVSSHRDLPLTMPPGARTSSPTARPRIEDLYSGDNPDVSLGRNLGLLGQGRVLAAMRPPPI